jgi:hypothetical protein
MINSLSKNLLVIFSSLAIVSCGGGGGGGGSTTPANPAPTVNLSAEPTSVLLENTSTLTWSSSYATSCSASWTTQTGTSGSEAVTISTVGNNSFSISCTGDGGSRSASVTVEGYRNTDGVVVDGYISGAEVCIDENDNWTCDSTENSTTSDNDGTFTIRYANGNLVSIGGTDLDSQTLLDNLLITHKLTGHSDFKAVTPVTSIAAFMEDSSLVNAALGIDASIDVFTFDPVANKGDGGINDFLYEKGNQLTVLAFALQNITNNLNTTTETTQDYFKAITEEIEKEFTETETKVDIETEAFVTKVFDNVITAKSVTIDETAKANTTKALAGVLPVIEVKSSDDLTTGVIRFAVSTLQTDIQAIAKGTASIETVTSYSEDVLTYIAEDQNIDSDKITPNISAIDDTATTTEDTAVTINVILNDSYLTSSPVSVSAGSGSNGTTILAESSPEQLLYTPNSDFNGTDTFSYTITQGDKTSSADVTVTIEAVNDAPTIDIASTIQVQENQRSVTSVSVSDIDEDELTLTLGGNDVSSFNLSSDNVLTFKEAPDYETKTSYSITLTLTDGIETLVKNIIVNLTNINDNSPVFTSGATFSASENQKAIGKVSATDADGDALAFSITGSEIQITSNGTLLFISSPDYETKNTYLATVKVTDGLYEISQDIVVNITDTVDTFTFKGKAIDGYISGANIFIDQNYNFKLDSGELTSVTDSSGSFVIEVNDESKFNCLKNRPIVADVPVGAVDSTLGEIENAFSMVLPSINDAGTDAIVITPFTNLLSQAIINAKSSSSISEDLTTQQGCENSGDTIAISVTNEINQVIQTIESSFGITLDDLVTDYIQGSSNSTINETKAQRIGSFLPFFKLIQDEIDTDLTNKYNKTINTNLTLRDSSINTILSDNTFSLLPIDFYTVYKTEPNASGWYTEESVRAKGAMISNNGEIHHFKCITIEENCITNNYSTSNIGDASEDYNNMTYFINPNYSTSENVAFFVQDNRRWGEQTRDGQVVLEKDCVFTEQLDFAPNERGDSWLNTRMNSSVLNYDIQVDSCSGLSSGDKNLFTAKTFTYETSSAYETSEMQYVNSSFAKAKYLKNKVEDPYTNRETIDLNAVITELKGLPYRYKDLNKARAYADDLAGDRVSMNFTMRDQDGTGLETHSITVRDNPDDDEYSKLERNSEGAYIETVRSVGQQARDNMFVALQASSGLNDEEFIGTESVKDNRVLISGKTIDGYISGATVFVDVNFNQRLDAGEYSASTDTNGAFELVVDENDLSCINARPLIANVPVGALDSTLGEVTKAYQMVLPSVNDAGSNQIVISPFTSLIGEAILKGKNSSDLSEDLSVAEGCAAAGDAVAENISTEVSSLINEIESAFNVTWENLISDFIATGGTSNITEDIAAKVAAFFPYYKEIKDEISSELTSRYNKDVTPNVSLSKDALEAILSDGEFTQLPLEFFSVYQTSPNAQGFYNLDEITSTGATVTANGELKRYLCTLSNSADCDITSLTLNGVGNASKNYNRQVNINNDNFTVDGVVGNINIRGRDSRGIRNEDSSPESYCESEEVIQFVGPQDTKGLQMEYRYGFGRGVNNLKDCSFLPNYGPSLSLRIEKQGRGENFPDTAPTWAIQFGVNNLGTSRLTESKVFNIIDNDNLDPEALIKEVALIPAAFSELADMRKLLSYGEGVYYYYSPNTSVDYDSGETFKTYYLQASSAPRDDQFYMSEYHPDNGSNDVGDRLFGQAARDAMFNLMSGSKYDYDGFIGESAPVSNILFEYESSGVQFNDRLINDKNRSYRVYPRLSSSSGWIDASLVGSEISKASIDAFINGDFTTNTTFNLGLNVDAPFTSVEEFNLKIFSNDQYSTSSEYLELTVELKIETLETGAVQVTWLDQGKVIFKFVDGDVSIIKNVINTDGDKTRSIPKGNYTFEDFDFLKSLLDKVRNQFGSSELQLIKDFFKNGSDYSYKIDLGAYAILDDYDQISSVIAGIFGIADTPMNSIYSYKNNIIFGEGTVEDICFDTAWTAEEDITFDIKPTYRNKPGFMTAEEVNFSSTSVTIEKGTSQKCITFSSPVDDKLQEKQEFIEFEIDNVVNAKSGRNIPTRLTVQDD